MGFFNKKPKSAAVENQEVIEEKIEHVDLNKVVSIYITVNNKFFSSRFFMGKKRNGVNYEIIIGIKESDLIKQNDCLELTYNLINSDRYVQKGFVVEKDNQLITVSLDTEVSKLQENRRSVKMCSELQGSVSILEKNINVELKNISIGGTFISTNYNLPVNHSIKLYIDELDINLTVIILRQEVNNYGVIMGYGCRFDNMTQRDEEIISQYINSCLNKERETLRSRDVYNYIFDDFYRGKT